MHEIFFYMSIGLLVIAVAIVSTIQIEKMVKFKLLSSLFKDLSESEKQKVKVAKMLFLLSLVSLIIGVLVQTRAL